MATKSKKRKKEAGPFSRGMTNKDLEGGGGFGDTVFLKKGDTLPLQFYKEPDEMLKFFEHQWEEDNKWHFVPCTGDDCALCDDEDSDRARKRKQWAAQVYNIKEKKPQILKMGRQLAEAVKFRYTRKPNSFTKRALELTKFATKPVTYDVSAGEDKPVDLEKHDPIDDEEWWEKQVKAYYGEDDAKASSLDDDDDDDDDDLEDDDEDEEDEKPKKKKGKKSKKDEDEEEEEEEEEDDDDDDDDDEEEEEEEKSPPKRSRSRGKKPAAKAPAKRRRTRSKK